MIPLTAAPSPLWYVDRATGAVTMLLLTASVVIGMGTTVRWRSPVWPRYISSTLHRNVSVMILVLLGAHVATSVLDPFAKLGLRDALVPFGSWYRPLWLGLGVVAAELVVALAVSSAVRRFIGYRVWRVLHWAAYAVWPVALVHGLGTGDDVRATWFLGLQAACVVAFWLALSLWRLPFGWPRLVWPRLLTAALSSVTVVALVVWLLNGPLAPGWARVAGTPLPLLEAAHGSPSPNP